MTSSLLRRALQITVVGLLISNTLAQSSGSSTKVAPGPITTLGCYSAPDPLTKAAQQSQFQSSGACQTTCGTQMGKAVMATTGGSTCYCGDELPPLNVQVDDSKCNSPCQGFGQENCGGLGFWQVYLTGVTGDVQTAPNTTTSSSTSSSATSSAASHAAETVVVTASSSATAAADNSGGPNKVGIAVGVVVGVVVLGALIGAALFYMKQKRRKEIEEEHKAQAAISSFVGSRSSDTKSDARLDPSIASTYRRESIGSIADERDFSRRILQVRNPDRGSMASVA